VRYDLRVLVKEYVRGTLRDPLQHLKRKRARTCPVCGFTGRFLSAGPRPEARCPNCASKECDRITGLYLRRHGIDAEGRRVLHFSPEKPFFRQWKHLPTYVAADVKRSRVSNAIIDITAIAFPDNYFDLVICHHVLEHVFDDARGMRECHRVLKPDGLAFFSVPMDLDRPETWERPFDMTLRRFEKIVGWDHKRLYGRDFPQKLERTGFRVNMIEFSAEEAERHGLSFSGLGLDRVYCCEKADGGESR
jgi:SAM-dependent methyltransferase